MAYILTGLKTNPTNTYTKQISVYGPYVHAEIIYTDENTDKEYRTNCWYCSLRKSFGKWWKGAPSEKDYIMANEWADKHLELIQKNCTAKVKKSECIWDLINAEQES